MTEEEQRIKLWEKKKRAVALKKRQLALEVEEMEMED
jgi:hypothetical protein